MSFIADYQVITDRDRAGGHSAERHGAAPGLSGRRARPAKVTIFQHSAIPELNQLMLPFLSLVSVAELSRNPTVKDEIAHSSQQAVNGLMFTYPVHQAADILFCKGTLVPVGRDQLPHVEMTRLVARRFNERYVRESSRRRRRCWATARCQGARRRQDEQEQGQRDPAVGRRGRDGGADPQGAHRLGAADHLRREAPARRWPICSRWRRCVSAATPRELADEIGTAAPPR